MTNPERAIAGLCGLIVVVVAFQAFVPQKYVPEPPAPTPKPVACVGSPIPVTFPYVGTVNDPWTCKVQCDDDKPRYILYSNGKATQCETPPGCNDFGEDNNITCNPPSAQSTK